MSPPPDPPMAPPRPHRRRLRLSVRGLIGLVLGAGVALGWLTHSSRGRNRALAGIEASGGRVYRAARYPAMPGQPWLTRLGRASRDRLEPWLGPGMVDDVEAVAFEGPATAADLAHLAWFAHLGKVTLEDTNRVGLGWRHLRGHPELTELVLRRYPEMTEPRLDGPGVDDAALAEVGRVASLTSLELHDPTALGPGYAALAGLPSLEELSLYGGDGPDDAAAARLLAGLPALRLLALHPDRASGRSATLEALARHHPDLNFLGLSGATLTDADCAALARLTHLTALHLQDVPLTDAGAGHLGKLTGLESLSLRDSGLTDSGLRALGGLVALGNLDLAGSSITDTGLAPLDRLPLVDLDLSRTRVSDAGMAALARIATLDHLNLSGLPALTDAGLVPLRKRAGLRTLVIHDCPKITAAGIAALKAALPTLRDVDSSRPDHPAIEDQP